MKFLNSKKLVVILLSLLSIATSVFFYYYVNKIDDKYSYMVHKELDIFKNIQSLTANSYRGFISTIKLVNAHSDAEQDSILKDRKIYTGRNDSLLNMLIKEVDTNLVDKKSLGELVLAREEYKTNYRYLNTRLYRNRDSAFIFLNRIFEPSFYKYQEKLNTFIAVNAGHYLRSSISISDDVNQKSVFMLVFGVSPIILFSIYLILLGGMLIFLLKKFLEE